MATVSADIVCLLPIQNIVSLTYTFDLCLYCLCKDIGIVVSSISRNHSYGIDEKIFKFFVSSLFFDAVIFFKSLGTDFDVDMNDYLVTPWLPGCLTLPRSQNLFGTMLIF